MEVPPSAPCWSNIVKKQPPPNQNQNGQAAATAERVFVGSCKSTKGIAVAVVDANAIIQGGEKLTNCADKFVSVFEVINEIRDPMSRHSLNFLPYTVDTMEPSPEALKKGRSFGSHLYKYFIECAHLHSPHAGPRQFVSVKIDTCNQ